MATINSDSRSAPAETGTETQKMQYRPRYIDIGINLADPIFRGRYHGKQRHPDDLHAVVRRAKEVGCTKLIVTGSSFRSSREALKLAEEFPNTVYATAGIHPCTSAIFGATHPHHHEASDEEHTAACDPDPSKPVAADDEHEIDQKKSDQIIQDLRDMIHNAGPSLVALGEFGLDYDRMHFCPRVLQLHSFERQLNLVASLSPEAQLPLFLHSRAAHADFVSSLKRSFGDRLEGLAKGGVVHSFTGSIEEARELMDLGLYIGVNGCSFKTVENCDVVREIRLDRLMIETDGPWCDIRSSHEGWKYLVEHAKREAEAQALAEAQPQTLAQAQAQVDEEGRAALTAVAAATPPVASAVSSALSSAMSSARSSVMSSAPDTPNDSSGRSTPQHPRRKKQPQQQQQQTKKPQKKAAEVPERFKSVKKEKWEEGAMVKSRNEPCMIERVAVIVAGIKGVSVEEVCEAAWANTVKVFGLGEK